MKEELPWIALPSVQIGFTGALLIGYGVLLAMLPEVRPGLVHILIGGSLGAVAGTLYGRPIIAHIKELKRAIPDAPWLRWVSLVWAPPTWVRFRCTVWLMALFFGSFAACALLLHGVASLGLLPASEGEDAIISSLPRCMVLLMVVFNIALATRIVMWVNTLDARPR